MSCAFYCSCDDPEMVVIILMFICVVCCKMRITFHVAYCIVALLYYNMPFFTANRRSRERWSTRNNSSRNNSCSGSTRTKPHHAIREWIKASCTLRWTRSAKVCLQLFFVTLSLSRNSLSLSLSFTLSVSIKKTTFLSMFFLCCSVLLSVFLAITLFFSLR